MEVYNKEQAEEEKVIMEETFRKIVTDAITIMDIPKFKSGDLELARSEKEIAKCRFLIEAKKKKKEAKLERITAKKTKTVSSNKRNKKARKDVFLKEKPKKNFNKKGIGKKR